MQITARVRWSITLTKPSLKAEKSTSSQHTAETIKVLVEELERLKTHLNIGHELTLKYLPNKNVKLSGEVKGECLYIYEEDEKCALTTLRHEFVDYVICKVIEPYEKLANLLISLSNEEAYAKKEMLIGALASVV